MIEQVVTYMLPRPIYCRLHISFLNIHIYQVLFIVHNMNFCLSVPCYRGIKLPQECVFIIITRHQQAIIPRLTFHPKMTTKLWPIKIKYNYILTLLRPDYLYHQRFQHITKLDVFLTRNSHINLKAECIFPIY